MRQLTGNVGVALFIILKTSVLRVSSLFLMLKNSLKEGGIYK